MEEPPAAAAAAEAAPAPAPSDEMVKPEQLSSSSDEGDEPEPAVDRPSEDTKKKQAPPAKVDRGVFVMCSTTKEQRATSEALALLNHYADLWEEMRAGASKPSRHDPSDLLDELRKEVAGLRGPQRRFEARYTHVKGILLFIYRGPWAVDGPDPVEFVVWMIGRMKEANEYGRFIARIIPLQVCVPAHQLLRHAQPLIAEKFTKSNPCSFEIEFACRNNNSFVRREVQMAILEMGLGYPHFVSHTMPQKTIIVEIANKTAGISVVPAYYSLARFNIQQQQHNKAKIMAEAHKPQTSWPCLRTRRTAKSRASCSSLLAASPLSPQSVRYIILPFFFNHISHDDDIWL